MCNVQLCLHKVWGWQRHIGRTCPVHRARMWRSISPQIARRLAVRLRKPGHAQHAQRLSSTVAQAAQSQGDAYGPATDVVQSTLQHALSHTRTHCHLGRWLLQLGTQCAQRCSGHVKFLMLYQRHKSCGSSSHVVVRINISAVTQHCIALVVLGWCDRTAAGRLQAAARR